jgi:hypothetical protein
VIKIKVNLTVPHGGGRQMLTFMGRSRIAVEVAQTLKILKIWPATNSDRVDRAEDADPFGVTDSWAAGTRTLDPG